MSSVVRAISAALVLSACGGAERTPPKPAPVLPARVSFELVAPEPGGGCPQRDALVAEGRRTVNALLGIGRSWYGDQLRQHFPSFLTAVDASFDKELAACGAGRAGERADIRLVRQALLWAVFKAPQGPALQGAIFGYGEDKRTGRWLRETAAFALQALQGAPSERRRFVQWFASANRDSTIEIEDLERFDGSF
jgi:hypothetical protein